MRKRGNNEGSVTKRGDKYLVQITIGYDETGKQVKKSRVAATAAEAREIMRELQDTYSCSLNIDDMILLKDWATKCLETYIKPRVRPNTYSGYFYNAKKYIIENPGALGQIPRHPAAGTAERHPRFTASEKAGAAHLSSNIPLRRRQRHHSK